MAHNKLFEIIDSLKDEFIGIWVDVGNIESPTPYKKGVDAVGYYFADYAKKEGMNKALFKVRILKNLFGGKKDETYSFFLGAVLSGEIEGALKSNAKTIAIGGKAQIKIAMAEIFEKRSDKKVVLLSEDEVISSTALGAIKIYENGGER